MNMSDRNEEIISTIMDNVYNVNGHNGIVPTGWNPTTHKAEYKVKWGPKDPLRINVKDIPWEMREKYISMYHIDDNTYKLSWTTQEPFDFDNSLFDGLISEIRRCVDYNIKYYNLDLSKLSKPLIIQVEVTARDGADRGYGEEELVFDPDAILEDMQKEIYYFGFLGGEGGNYFDADYFEIIRNPDKTFSWKEGNGPYSSEDRTFASRRLAKNDAIKTMTPDDGSKMLVSTDPDELFDKIYPEEEEEIPEDIL